MKFLRATAVCAVLGAGVTHARGEPPTSTCQRWNIEVACSVSAPAVVIGESFTATVVAKNTGDTALSNVTIRVRADQGAPCVAGQGASTSLLVEKLEAGETKTLTAKFVTEGMGTARILGSARDSLGWAAGNCACTVEVYGLPAIQTEMTDKDAAGAEKGIFRVGEEVVYHLSVENDQGSSVTPELRVLLSLPKELAFVSGSSDTKATVTGEGQAGETTTFTLVPPNAKVSFQFRVKVLAAPPSQLVKVKAVVQTPGGVALATEVESTTIQ
jgi:hypothetical protein